MIVLITVIFNKLYDFQTYRLLRLGFHYFFNRFGGVCLAATFQVCYRPPNKQSLKSDLDHGQK